MKKRLIIGGLLAVGVYALYKRSLLKPSFPNGVPLGNVLDPGDPYLYVAAAAGLLGGYAFD